MKITNILLAYSVAIIPISLRLWSFTIKRKFKQLIVNENLNRKKIGFIGIPLMNALKINAYKRTHILTC